MMQIHYYSHSDFFLVAVELKPSSSDWLTFQVAAVPINTSISLQKSYITSFCRPKRGKGILQNCTLRWQEGSHLVVEVGEHRPLEGLAELRRLHLFVVLLVAGSTDSRLRSSDSLHKQRRDLDRRSIERIVLRNPLGCWRQVDRELLEWLQLETEHLHNHRTHHRSSLDDRRRLAGNLGHSHAVEVGFL